MQECVRRVEQIYTFHIQYGSTAALLSLQYVTRYVGFKYPTICGAILYNISCKDRIFLRFLIMSSESTPRSYPMVYDD